MRSWYQCLTYLTVFLVCLVAGWSQTEGEITSRAVTEPFWQDALSLAAHNLAVLTVLVLTSLLTFGVSGLVFWAVNGYVFGAMVGMLPSDKMMWLMLYAPLEISAFLCGSVAAYRFSMTVFSWLREGAAPHRSALNRSAILLTVGVVTMLVAALLEAWAIRLSW